MLVGVGRLAPGLFGVDGDECADLRVERVDAREGRLDEFTRRDLSRTDQLGLFDTRQPQKFVVHDGLAHDSPNR